MKLGSYRPGVNLISFPGGSHPGPIPAESRLRLSNLPEYIPRGGVRGGMSYIPPRILNSLIFALVNPRKPRHRSTMKGDGDLVTIMDRESYFNSERKTDQAHFQAPRVSHCMAGISAIFSGPGGSAECLCEPFRRAKWYERVIFDVHAR